MIISKNRSEKTRKRQRQSSRGKDEASSPRTNPIIGVAIVTLFWLVTSAIMLTGRMSTHFDSTTLTLKLTGEVIFLLVGIFTTGVFFEIVKPDLLKNNPRLALLALIGILSAAICRSVLYLSDRAGISPAIAHALLPMGMAPMLITILIDSEIAVASGLLTSSICAILTGASLPVFIAGATATVVAASRARNVRTRARVFKAGITAGLAEVACIFGIVATTWTSGAPYTLPYQAAACVASGLISAAAVILLLPFFEAAFRITTDITLLEMSDLGHPLLQRLALEAPGTYHHSLIVASLAQAASEEIDANALLARVGSYYHDIGKLTKPQFFTENVRWGVNPHDELPPSMSTLVITAHVKEGISLAMLHRLPPPVIDIIKEHHGTGLLSCFHHKAKTQLEFDLRRQDGAVPTSDPHGAVSLSESGFRYACPKPSSKESAIISIADAVEAASRSMEKKSPGQIEQLVSDIVEARFEDGQLDDCNLSLAELARVKRSFAFTLTAILHGRVPYPRDENRDRQPTKNAAGEETGAKEPDSVPDAENSRN